MAQNDSQLNFLLFGDEDGENKSVEIKDQEEFQKDMKNDKASETQTNNEGTDKATDQKSSPKKGRPPGKNASSSLEARKELSATTEIELGEGWTINYASKVTPVDDLFDPAAVANKQKVKIEDIRLHYSNSTRSAEMTPTGTKWEMIESKKQLFPRVIGASKG